jgi:hypothetical protein
LFNPFVTISQDEIKGLPADSRDWLTHALDPFHDNVLDKRGMPDRISDNSIIQVVNHSISIAAPAGTAGNWSAAFFTLPIMGSATCYQGAKVTGAVGLLDGTTAAPAVGSSNVMALAPASVAASYPVGTVNAYRWTTDTGMFFPDGVNAWTGPAAANSYGRSGVANADGSQSKQRVVSLAFEVLNTTAEIYRQGTVTVYRSPYCPRRFHVNSLNDSVVRDGGTLQNTGIWPAGHLFLHENGPAPSIAAALNYPGAAQWPASRGAYCVARQDVDANEPQFFESCGTYITSNGRTQRSAGTDGLFGGISDGLYTPLTGAGITGANTWRLAPNAPPIQATIPYAVTGALFTGLSLQTTLTLNVKITYEVFPMYDDPAMRQLLFALGPSPDYDPTALALYFRASNRLPPGVPQDMNPDGEFWDNVLKVIGRVARPASELLGFVHPVAGLAAKAVGSVASNMRVGMAKKAAKPKGKVQKKKKFIVKK